MSGGGISEGLMATLPWYSRLIRILRSHWDEQQRVRVLGYRDVGSNQSKLRFLASRATHFVTVHVQHNGGGGGGVNYNTGTYVSSTRRDLRSDRQYDETINRDGTNQFFVWLIPELLEPDGTYTKFDGADADDQMAFVDLGT